ncbi:MAG TPA: protein-disulfide reductase DsbD domain-containing protein [Terriglobales bacterium]|nr:protein-disulfide reductase DsbD domain-containing protein [Terriglobales bacterium]
MKQKHNYVRGCVETGDSPVRVERRGLPERNGAALVCVLLCAAAFAQNLDQDISGRKAPSITLTPPGVTTVTRGKPGTVELRFRVSSGFHVNSNTPKSEFLIPTALNLEAPTDIVVGKITYPDGEEMSFPFSPNDKLSVYTGEFPLQVVVRPLSIVVPGKYMLRGELKYQACDNAACYPPKKLPVEFEVKVVKAPPPARKNPAQSPHVHG